MYNPLVLLMSDSSESDGSAETVMDYVISYTLRSVNNYEFPIFSRHARNILFKLLELEDENQEITRIEVWKQWGEKRKRMDLCVEVDLIHQGETYHHALLIEDKYYSGIRYDDELGEFQIETYKRIFDSYYTNMNVIKHYWVISCISENDEKFDLFYGHVGKYNFKACSIYTLVNDIQEECESDLFNQFFLTGWC